MTRVAWYATPTKNQTYRYQTIQIQYPHGFVWAAYHAAQK